MAPTDSAPRPAQTGTPAADQRPKPSPRRVRRTQEERSTETRERLLDATVQCLIELGYARTTTTVVCERAGLSRGAQVHHFPKKEDLVIQAVAHMARRQEAELLERGRVTRSGGDSLTLLLEEIVRFFVSPIFYAAMELWVAARTDPVLHQSLVGFERAVGKRLTELWSDFGGTASQAPDFRAVVELTMQMAQGMALQKILRDDDERERHLIEVWKRMVTQALSPSD